MNLRVIRVSQDCLPVNCARSPSVDVKYAASLVFEVKLLHTTSTPWVARYPPHPREEPAADSSALAGSKLLGPKVLLTERTTLSQLLNISVPLPSIPLCLLSSPTHNVWTIDDWILWPSLELTVSKHYSKKASWTSSLELSLYDQ